MNHTDTFKTNLTIEKLEIISNQVRKYASKEKLQYVSLDEAVQRDKNDPDRIDIYVRYMYPKTRILAWDHLLYIHGDLISEAEYKRRRRAGYYAAGY